jgi:hypothetical protein
VSEARVEKYLVDRVEAKGGRAFKWVSPGTAGVMDRLVLLPVPPEHRDIVNRYIKLIEVKDKNQKTRPLQNRVATWIQALGFEVRVVDSRPQVDEAMN